MGIFSACPKPTVTPPVDTDSDAAITFWQSEVHYYEGRAGGQGEAAQRIITVAVGATALIPIVAGGTELNKKLDMGIADVDVRLFLYAIPAIVLLLWATAIRLLHEMAILREFRYHAEQQVKSLSGAEPRFRSYRPWDGIGSRFDKPVVITTTWFVLAVAVSGVGIGATMFALAQFTGELWWIPLVLLGLVVAALVWTAITNRIDADKVAKDLEQPGPGKRKKALKRALKAKSGDRTP